MRSIDTDGAVLAWAIGTVLDVLVAQKWSVFASARAWASVTCVVANAVVRASICAFFVIDIDHPIAIHVEGASAVLFEQIIDQSLL